MNCFICLDEYNFIIGVFSTKEKAEKAYIIRGYKKIKDYMGTGYWKKKNNKNEANIIEKRIDSE